MVTEPDELEFKDEETGLNCYISRNVKLFGHLWACVVIPIGHPLYRDDIFSDLSKLPHFKVHGGISYYGGIYIGNKIEKCCLGFSDINNKGRFKDINFMKSECIKLAKQISDKVKYSLVEHLYYSLNIKVFFRNLLNNFFKLVKSLKIKIYLAISNH